MTDCTAFSLKIISRYKVIQILKFEMQLPTVTEVSEVLFYSSRNSDVIFLYLSTRRELKALLQ